MQPEEYERLDAQETTHFWYRGLHRLVLLEMARIRRLGAHADRQPPRLLDAGCGTGGLMRTLAPTYAVTGLDLHPRALALAAAEPGGPLVRGSVSALPFAPRCFDAILSADVLYHAAVRDDGDALREFHRVLKPGGRVVLNLPAHEWLRGAHDRQVHTARRYSKRRVRELARAAGFEIERMSWFNCVLFPAAALVRLLSRGDDARSDVRELPRPLNGALSLLLCAEAAIAQRVGLPFGLSLFATLRKGEPRA